MGLRKGQSYYNSAYKGECTVQKRRNKVGLWLRRNWAWIIICLVFLFSLSLPVHINWLAKLLAFVLNRLHIERKGTFSDWLSYYSSFLATAVTGSIAYKILYDEMKASWQSKRVECLITEHSDLMLLHNIVSDSIPYYSQLYINVRKLKKGDYNGLTLEKDQVVHEAEYIAALWEKVHIKWEKEPIRIKEVLTAKLLTNPKLHMDITAYISTLAKQLELYTKSFKSLDSLDLRDIDKAREMLFAFRKGNYPDLFEKSEYGQQLKDRIVAHLNKGNKELVQLGIITEEATITGIEQYSHRY